MWRTSPLCCDNGIALPGGISCKKDNPDRQVWNIMVMNMYALLVAPLYLYKVPYKRLSLRQAIHQALLHFGGSGSSNPASKSYEIERMPLTWFIWGGTGGRKKSLNDRIFIPKISAISWKHKEKVSDQTEYFFVPSLFDEQKKMPKQHVGQSKSLVRVYWSMLEIAEGRAILWRAHQRPLANKQEHL